MEKYKEEDWLREQYIENGRSANDIAKDFDITHAAISCQLHKNGIRTGRRDEYKYICPDCNVPQKNPSQHLTKSDCQRPEISDVQEEMLKGLVMGDGSIIHHSKNWSISWGSINKEFMEWFDWRMGDLGIEVYKSRSDLEERRKQFTKNSSHTREEVMDFDFHEVYQWKTVTHPEINNIFNEWVSEEQKKFPEDIDLTPISLCIWYCGDGGLVWDGNGNSSYVKISTVNESENIQNIIKSFNNKGLYPEVHQQEMEGFFDNPHTYTSIAFFKRERDKFFDYIGQPPPGFEYKWELEDRQKYERLMENSKTKMKS